MMSTSKPGSGNTGCRAEGALPLAAAGQLFSGWPLGNQGRADLHQPPGRACDRPLPACWRLLLLKPGQRAEFYSGLALRASPRTSTGTRLNAGVPLSASILARINTFASG